MTSLHADFLARKAQYNNADGFVPTWLPDFLFPFQADLVDWAVRMGRCAIFADCGLGKTPMQLVWAENVRAHSGRPVLIVTPLAVAYQTVDEAGKFGVTATVSRDGQAHPGITVTNYEQLEKFDTNHFGGVVCDESSAIKSFDGKRRAVVTEFLRTHRYRLLCTATAAPNDYTELGTSSEALGYLGHMDMLNRFFVNANKTSATRAAWRGHGVEVTPHWRFKGHSQDAFWQWVSSWARAIRRPSDFGYPDDGFALPDLKHYCHIVESTTPPDDMLFAGTPNGLQEERAELRRTILERCETAAKVLADADSAVAWCHLNAESKLLTELIAGAVEVSGTDSPEDKERKLHAFSRGEIRVLVTKPSIGAWGLNWQHCHRMTFFPSHSYEQYYQAVRRSWRFGQTHPVQVDVITTKGGEHVLANLQRKSDQAVVMFDQLIRHMRNAAAVTSQPHNLPVEVPAWAYS